MFNETLVYSKLVRAESKQIPGLKNVPKSPTADDQVKREAYAKIISDTGIIDIFQID